jgi:protein tyrosine phosphatase
MIIEQNVSIIVCVCRLEEKGWPKCHCYWPEKKSDGKEDKEFKKLIEGEQGLDVRLTREITHSKDFTERIF